MSVHSDLNLLRVTVTHLHLILLFCVFAVGLDFEKFSPKSEESTGVNKSAEGGEGVSHHAKHCTSSFLGAAAVCY